MRLLNLLEEHIDSLDGWISIINSYNSVNLDSTTAPPNVELTYKTTNVFIEISQLFFSYGAFKDKFDNSLMSPHIYGFDVYIKSKKTETEIRFGIDDKGIYLETYLKHFSNLRHMGDDFYKDIFALMDLGEFSTPEYELFGSETTKKYPDIFKNQKSEIFNLLRTYIIGIVEGKNNIPSKHFRIYWSYSLDFHDILYNSCLAFKLLYNLNYSLWKATH